MKVFYPQTFLMNTFFFRFQATNKVPVFEVSHLDLGSDLKIYLYAENVKVLFLYLLLATKHYTYAFLVLQCTVTWQ